LAGIFIEIVGNASQFRKELDSAVAATAKANSGFRKMSKAAGIAGLALGGVLAFGMEKSVKAAMGAQESTARLDQAFKNAGLAAGLYSTQIDKAESAGRKLGFTDADVKDSLGSLLTATGNVAASMKDLGVAEDLARFKHVGLSDASKMLSMAMTGSQRAAKQLGITVIPLTTAVDKLKASHIDLSTAAGKAALAHAKLLDKMATGQAVIDAVTAKTKGQGEAFAGTAAGGMAQFHAQLDHLEVKMGEGLLPAITAVVEKLSAFADFLSRHATLAKVAAIALGGLAAALLAVAAAGALADLALSPILLPLAAVVVAVGALSFVVYKLVTDFQNSWPLLLPIVLGPLGLIIAAVIHWHSQIAGAFSAGWDFVKGLTGRAWDWMKGAIGDALHWIGDRISEGFHHDIDVITNLGPAFLNAAKGLGDKMVSGIVNGLSDLVSQVENKFGDLWKVIKGLASEAFGFAKSIGLAIVRGIISGLAGLASELGHAISDAVSGALSHIPVPHVNIPHFAKGVSNFSGGLALVGERGPELLSLPGGSSVTPMRGGAGALAFAGSGGGDLHVHFDGPVYADDRGIRELTDKIRRELLRNQNRNGGLGFVT
jgi:hypothetical protein